MSDPAPFLLRVQAWMAQQPQLVDVHVHLAADGGPGMAPDHWPALADQAGIRTAAVFPPTRTGGYTAANAALRRLADASDGRLRAFARIGGPVPLTVPAAWQVRRALRSRVGAALDPPEEVLNTLHGADGVKLLPHLDGFPPDPVLAVIAEKRLPVLVHGGEHVSPGLIERRLVRRLRGPVLIGHLGAFPASAPHLEGALRLAEIHDHVYLDTSASWLAEFVAVAARRVPHKVVFGSDAPLMHPAVAWRHVVAAVVDDRTCELIAHRNAEEVLGW